MSSQEHNPVIDRSTVSQISSLDTFKSGNFCVKLLKALCFYN